MKKIPFPAHFNERSTHIHILGAGNLGKLIGHSLRQQHPKMRITYIMRNEDDIKNFLLNGNKVEIARNGEWTQQEFFEARTNDQGGQLIRNLIVTTKSHHTFDAIKAMRFRLNGYTSLCFVQNGMGILEEVDQLWKRMTQKPKWLMGIVSHGAFHNSDFSTTHAGIGEILIGSAFTTRIRPKLGSETVNPKFIEKMLLPCEPLHTKLLTPREVYMAQLRKVAVNSVINPLTTIFNCKNGELFKREEIIVLMKKVIEEMSPILIATAAERVKDDDGAYKEELSAESLEKLVWDIGAKTAENISSMRQDREQNRATEIDYMNGYIARQALANNLPFDLTKRLMQLVKVGTLLDPSEAPSILDKDSPLLVSLQQADNDNGGRTTFRLWSLSKTEDYATERRGGKIKTAVQRLLDQQAEKKRLRNEKKELRKTMRNAGASVKTTIKFPGKRKQPSSEDVSARRLPWNPFAADAGAEQLESQQNSGEPHMIRRLSLHSEESEKRDSEESTERRTSKPFGVRTVTSMTGPTPLDVTKTFKFH